MKKRPNENLKRIYLYVPVALEKQLAHEADEDGRSLSDYIRRLLEQRDVHRS